MHSRWSVFLIFTTFKANVLSHSSKTLHAANSYLIEKAKLWEK